MSVWRRLQRVGKKAARFQITASLHELNIECSKQYKPGTLIVVLSRRSRRYPSKPFEPVQSNENVNQYQHIWSMPENVEFVTTFYRSEKAIQYEEKEWICQIEDVGVKNVDHLSGPTISTRRRILATRQIDLAEFASNLPTQTNLKVVMRLASKKLTSANILITLNAVIIKEGDATDEDMISLASLMSLSRAGSFNVGHGLTINDVGGLNVYSPTIPRFSSMRLKNELKNIANNTTSGGVSSKSDFHSDLSELTTKLQALERSQIEDTLAEVPDKVDDNVNGVQTNKLQTTGKQEDNLSDSVKDKFDLTNFKFPHSHNSNESASTIDSTHCGQELLIWCQNVTKSYKNVQITNLTKSFQNGLAFCAILHHFFPDRIDYASLTDQNPVENCRLAFDQFAKLGIPRVIDPSEVVSLKYPPDLLIMMTYLHQIRNICGEKEPTYSQINSLKHDIINTKERRLENDISSLLNNTHINDHNEHIQKYNIKDISTSNTTNNVTASTTTPPTTPTTTTTDHIIDKNVTNRSNEKKQEPQQKLTSSTKKHISLINYEHMLAKARSLLQQSHTNQLSPYSKPDALPPSANSHKPPHPWSSSLNTVPITDTHTDKQIIQSDESSNHQDSKFTSKHLHRKSHRKLYRFNSDGTICASNGDQCLSPNTVIGSTNNGIMKPFRYSSYNMTTMYKSSVENNDNLSHNNDSKSSTEQIKIRKLRLSQMNLFASGRGNTAPVPVRIGEHHLGNKINDKNLNEKPGSHLTNENQCVRDGDDGNPNLSTITTFNYILNEQIELEQAQKQLDNEAAILEPCLREQMMNGPGTKTEEELLNKWFNLVNRKNALIRRSVQLSIMEKEDDLKKKMYMLQDELRQMLSVKDNLKTDADRKREELLLQDLVRLVNERDDMIQVLDIHEKALAEELDFEHNMNFMSPSRRRLDKNCVIQ